MQGHCLIIADLEKSTESGTYTNLCRRLLNTSLENISMFEEVGEKDQWIMLYVFCLTPISRMPISLAILYNKLPIILEEVKTVEGDKKSSCNS